MRWNLWRVAFYFGGMADRCAHVCPVSDAVRVPIIISIMFAAHRDVLIRA